MNVFGRVNRDFGHRNVHHFVSVRCLYPDAAAGMRLAGVEPVPVPPPAVASALRLLQGALHCCCGSM